VGLKVEEGRRGRKKKEREGNAIKKAREKFLEFNVLFC